VLAVCPIRTARLSPLEVDYIPMPDGHRELNHSGREAPPEPPSPPVFHPIDRPETASSAFEEPPVER
jgi:hypothetical protein